MKIQIVDYDWLIVTCGLTLPYVKKVKWPVNVKTAATLARRARPPLFSRSPRYSAPFGRYRSEQFRNKRFWRNFAAKSAHFHVSDAKKTCETSFGAAISSVLRSRVRARLDESSSKVCRLEQKRPILQVHSYAHIKFNSSAIVIWTCN